MSCNQVKQRQGNHRWQAEHAQVVRTRTAERKERRLTSRAKPPQQPPARRHRNGGRGMRQQNTQALDTPSLVEEPPLMQIDSDVRMNVNLFHERFHVLFFSVVPAWRCQVQRRQGNHRWRAEHTQVVRTRTAECKERRLTSRAKPPRQPPVRRHRNGAQGMRQQNARAPASDKVTTLMMDKGNALEPSFLMPALN